MDSEEEAEIRKVFQFADITQNYIIVHPPTNKAKWMLRDQEFEKIE